MAFGFGFGMPRSFAVPPFSPASLFANGEQGWWYDPSNLSTLFQDSAGTVPVTAIEQPVGLQLDLSKGLVLGPELVTNPGPFVTSDGWSNFTTGTTSTVSGALRVSTGASAFGGAYTSISTIVGKVYKVQVSSSFVSGGSASNARTYKADNTGNSVNKINGFAGSGAGSFVFTATATTTYINVASSTANDVFDWSNISVRELPGNHRFQTTSANRPVVSARVNLLTKTEDFASSDWTKNGLTVSGTKVTAPNGTQTAETLVWASGSAPQLTRATSTTISAGTPLQYSLYAKAGTKSSVTLILFTDGSNYALCSFNLATGLAGTVASFGSQYTSITRNMTLDSNGFYRCVLSANTNTLTTLQTWVRGDTMVGSGDNITIWGADLRVTNVGVNLPAYQRVNTSTDYDSTGFPIYIKPNGSNQFMQTNSINFSSTDKMTVWQGVRKLSDANTVMLIELSTAAENNNGAFNLIPRNLFASYFLQAVSRGSIVVTTAGTTNTAYAAPLTLVLANSYDISGDSIIVRANTVQAISNTADQGTGNFGNYPAYFYARGGTSLFFNGHDYGSIARGAASTAAQITAGETYINNLTKAYAP